MASNGPVKSAEQFKLEFMMTQPITKTFFEFLDKSDLAKLDLHIKDQTRRSALMAISSAAMKFDPLAVNLLEKLAPMPHINWNDYWVGEYAINPIIELSLKYQNSNPNPTIQSLGKKAYAALLIILRDHSHNLDDNLGDNPSLLTIFAGMALKGFFEPLEIVLKNPKIKNLDFKKRYRPYLPSVMEKLLTPRVARILLPYIPVLDASIWNDAN